MIELKAYRFLGQDEVWPDANLGSDYYLKSEADKVIAEKDAEIARLKAIRKVHIEAIESMGAGLQQDEEKILHHKYKRCLAMAWWCEAEAHRSLTEQSAIIDFPEIDRFQYLQWNFTHFSRWHRRWLKLAKKFKEVK